MLMLEHLDALAQTSAQAISGIKFDKVVVWENGGNGSGTTNTAHFLQNLARVMPPMMQVLKDVGGVEMPEFLARLTHDPLPASGPALAPAAPPQAEGNSQRGGPPAPGAEG
jgi:flotillin